MEALEVAEMVSGSEVDPPPGGVSVPGPAMVTPAGGWPTQLVYVSTGETKPPTDETMMMTVVLLPCATVTVL